MIYILIFIALMTLLILMNLIMLNHNVDVLGKMIAIFFDKHGGIDESSEV